MDLKPFLFPVQALIFALCIHFGSFDLGSVMLQIFPDKAPVASVHVHRRETPFTAVAVHQNSLKRHMFTKRTA